VHVTLPPTSAWRRSLDRIRAEGRPLDVPELAGRLLRLAGAPPATLARRLLAAALECPPEALPERFEAADLRALRHGLLGRPAGAADSPGAVRSRAELPLARAAYTVVDLETTGLSADAAAILEIGAVRVEGLCPTARFATLVDPGGAIPASITRLTGIDAELVADAPATAVAVPALHRWLATTPDAAFVAHNAGFDARFLARAFERAGLAPLPGPVLCTRRLGRRLVPTLGRFDLDSLCARFGVANRARHRALGDADATARVLLELLALARAEGVETLGELVDLQERPLPRRPRRSRRRAVRAAGRG
jgi:DNA polymerase III epsilon subunit family exonuclease